MNDQCVLIVGGGPVGLICAYALGRAGVPVVVFDENDELQEDPRAATTHPATLELLDQIDVVDEVAARGLTARTFQFWDRPTGELVAEFDHDLLRDDTKFPYVVQCEQFKLCEIIKSRVDQLAGCDYHFSHRVTAVRTESDRVIVTVDTPDGPAEHAGRYLIGCDGGRSLVRKQAGIKFDGFTWPERFLVLSTQFDFEANRGMCYRNYVADPDEWCNCFKVAGDGPPGIWRTVYPVDPEAPEDELLADAFTQQKLQAFFPIDEPYDIIHRNLYNVHQRVAATFRKGRVLLAGDAAHVNNSIGGMGLNGGIQDAINLAEKLARVWHGEADESELDLYDLQRRTYAVDFVQQQTIQNKKRLEAKDPETRRQSMDELRATAEDPKRAREFLLGSSMIAAMRRAGKMQLTAK
ncbi:MAG: NAD(P)/FAD-dependent oxidoreductase [Alphaproteobacteria bacterium]|nr:NAD(P)/FAD-dependent oxidoreductase [Alphaproteobacteria bacterium]